MPSLLINLAIRGSLSGIAIAIGTVLLLFTGCYLFNLVRLQYDLRNLQQSSGEILKAPQIPYVVPWIGNAPSFLVRKPNQFWKELFSWYPRSAGVCSIILGGNKTNVVFNVPATQYIMKDRKMGRGQFNEQVVVNGFGVSKEECEKFYEYHIEPKHAVPGHHEQEKMNVEYMLKTESVNELTSEFVASFKHLIADKFKEEQEVDLYAWVRSIVFTASTKALLGSKILQVVPNCEELFFDFDSDMLAMFFGLPKWMTPKQTAQRDRITNKFVEWHEAVEKESNGEIIDPDTIVWEPLYGSRLNRARQLYYRRKDLSIKSIAGLDLGMLFGIASNATPATGWMLMHILDSARPENQVQGQPSLYDYVMAEIKDSVSEEGSIDVATVINQPILQSTLHEVLRMYVDTLVSRAIDKDMTLPLTHPSTSSGKKSDPTKSLLLKAGTLLMMPTWPAHNNPDTWQSPEDSTHPPFDVFYPYRFLTSDPSSKSDKPIFTTAHANGTFFPFGGGKTICPGRNFAKQEIIASVAMLLLNFEFEVRGYVDGSKKDTREFPGLRETLPGSAVMNASGDLKVKVKRR